MTGMRHPCLPLLALAATLAASRGHATTVEVAGAAPSQPSARTWATRDQLHACLDAEAALKERARAIDASNAAHQKMLDEVEAESVRLKDAQDMLDHDSSTAVKRFNRMAKEHNEHVQRLNQDAADSLPATNAYNESRTAYNRQCGGQTYRAEDMEAETKERKKAGAL